MLKEEPASMTTSETTLTSFVSVTTKNVETKSNLTFQKHVTVALYVLTVIFCLFSNVILNYLLFTRKYMRIKYIFTASISISHIIFCLIVIPLAIFILVTNNELLDVQTLACDVITCFCIGVTSQSMFTTAIRRCLAISERFRHANFTYRGKVKNFAFIWAFALASSMPYIFKDNRIDVFSKFTNRPNISPAQNSYNETTSVVATDNKNPGNTSYILRNSNPNSTESTTSDTSVIEGFFIYNMVLLFVQMIIPCVAALVLQTVTLFGLKRRPNQIHWVKEIRITKQHICMAAVFLVCWFPLMLTNVIASHTSVPDHVFHFLQPIAVSSLIYFPIIYYALNDHIKREFLLLIQNVINREQPN